MFDFTSGLQNPCLNENQCKWKSWDLLLQSPIKVSQGKFKVSRAMKTILRREALFLQISIK